MCMDSSKTSGSTQDEGIYEIIKEIISANPLILIKHQQRNEDDLNNEEKFHLAKDIYDKSKLIFFMRFGKFLNQSQLNHLDDIFKDYNDLNEIKIIIDKLKTTSQQRYTASNVKNRRFQALKKLIDGDSYFTETEMMKRNPLLYEQLVGQYLTRAEIRERDRNVNPTSFVSILLDGIEREHAENTLKSQKEYENNAMEEEESSDEDEAEVKSIIVEESIEVSSPIIQSRTIVESTCELPQQVWGEFSQSISNSSDHITCDQSPQQLWGEFAQSSSKTPDPTTHFQRRIEKTMNHKQNVSITTTERRMLRDEFVSLMYESFLSGNDDYDYTEIDNDEQYDDMDMIAHDEEDKYFDSEEPVDAMLTDGDDSDGFIERKRSQSSSDDELDMFMNALNNHPTVCNLTAEMKK